MGERDGDVATTTRSPSLFRDAHCAATEHAFTIATFRQRQRRFSPRLQQKSLTSSFVYFSSAP